MLGRSASGILFGLMDSIFCGYDGIDSAVGFKILEWLDPILDAV